MESKIVNRILSVIFPILMLIFGNNCMADSNEPLLKKIPENLVGFWVDDCGTPTGSLNLDNDTNNNAYAIMGLFYVLPNYEEFENRIFISIKLTKNPLNSNLFDVYLKEPDDVGLSVKLSWDDYAQDVPICSLELLNSKSMKINWLGFLNVKTQQREWKDNPVWISKEHSGILKKCLTVSTPEDFVDEFNQYIFKSENEDVLFYFKTATNTGKIVVEGKEYLLNKITSTEDGIYSLSGANIKISTSKINPFEDEGGDCTGGSFENITITLISDGSTVSVSNATMVFCQGGDE